MAKNDIKKIDEQIEILKGKKETDEAHSSEGETVVREIVDPNDENHVINIDYIDSEVKESTKELKELDSLTDGEVKESTKELNDSDSLADSEIQKNENESENKINSSLDSSSNTKKIENINKKNDNKKNKNIIIFAIIGVVILILIIALIVFMLLNNKNSNDDIKKKDKETEEKKLTNEEMIKLVDLYGSKLENEINNYYNTNNKLPEFSTVNSLVKMDNEIICRVHEIYEDRKIYLDECMVDYVDVIHSYGVKQEIKEKVDNNNVKVYVGKNTYKATLEKPDDIENYIVYSSNIDGQVRYLRLLGNSEYVYYYDENGKMQLYNYILEKRALYKIEYESVDLIQKYKADENGKYSTDYVFLENKGKYRVYSLKKGKATTDEYDIINSAEVGKDKIVVFKNKKAALVNYVTNNLLIPFECDYIAPKGNYLSCSEGEFGTIFDSDGNAYLSDKGENGMFLNNGIVDNYVFHKNELYSVNGDVLCKFEDVLFNNYYSGYVMDDKLVYYDGRNSSNKCYLYDISKKECSVVEQEKCHR